MLPFELTKDTPYLALSGELWSVFYEYFNRNWPCYKGFLLYLHKVAHLGLEEMVNRQSMLCVGVCLSLYHLHLVGLWKWCSNKNKDKKLITKMYTLENLRLELLKTSA